MKHKGNYWFRAKEYGYGWYPATWQGWLVLGAWLVVFVILLFVFESIRKFNDGLATIILLVGSVASSSILILISKKTGEPAAWRWGESKNTKR